MDKELIERFLAATSDVVNAPGSTWREKREEIIEAATEDQMVAVREFASWFDSNE